MEKICLTTLFNFCDRKLIKMKKLKTCDQIIWKKTVGGRMGGGKSGFKDCLQQSKMGLTLNVCVLNKYYVYVCYNCDTS